MRTPLRLLVLLVAPIGALGDMGSIPFEAQVDVKDATVRNLHKEELNV